LIKFKNLKTEFIIKIEIIIKNSKMFCCRRSSNAKIINDNFKQVEQDMTYFKNEISYLTAELKELREKQQQTKKNLVKIIDTFSLNEYVLFKTRLLTKKQTYDLIQRLYEFYEIPLRYRETSGSIRLDSEIFDSEKIGSLNEELISFQNIIHQINNLKRILDKLEVPQLKDNDYALKKVQWCCPNEPKCNPEFLDNVIQCIKDVM